MRKPRYIRKKKKARKPIGIIAEDRSDVAVLDVLIRKLAKAPYFVRSFVGEGCGKIVGKCHAWAQNLRDYGCRYLVVVHDLDRNDIDQLRDKIKQALGQSPISPYLIVIPVREIEAWLLSDHHAIERAMKLKDRISKIANPEAILNPKEHLADLVYRKSRKSRRYVNALDNPKIAVECATNNLSRCASFVSFSEFIVQHIK
jgi:hypothetical protein